VGIGVLTSAVPERKRVTVILTFPGSPAEEAGLQIHDNILAADGRPILDESGFRRDLLRGLPGTQVTLTVQTPGQEPREVTLTRRAINSSVPVPHNLVTSPSGKRVGYLLIPTFFDETISGQIAEALRDLSAQGQLDGLILDNRQNEGGAEDVFANTLGYFTHGTLGYFANRENERALTIHTENIKGSQKVPLVVLVGSGTASFGEIFSGILQDIGRAYVLGQTTDGNVEILYVYDFSDGSRAWIAHDYFKPIKHPDQNWEKTGIIPDMTVLSNWDEVTQDTDPAIKAALEHFDALK
jgi:carboxyl-terminal processing protease